MKTLAKIIFVAAGVAVAIPVTNAADPAAPTAGGKHPRLHALLVRKAIRQSIAHRLGLSAEQVSQFKADRAKTVAALKAIRADSSLSAEQKKAKMRETVQAARTEMRGVLTADQQAKLEKIRAHLRARSGRAV